MKEKPILFSTPMVRAILFGKKTQTRRIISSLKGFGRVSEIHPRESGKYFVSYHKGRHPDNTLTGSSIITMTGYEIGGILWVREAWRKDGDQTVYLADSPNDSNPFKPSIHLARKDARLFLKISGLRLENLRDISESDARNEGFDSAKEFFRLWSALPGTPYAKGNPVVLVIEFEVLKK